MFHSAALHLCHGYFTNLKRYNIKFIEVLQPHKLLPSNSSIKKILCTTTSKCEHHWKYYGMCAPNGLFISSWECELRKNDTLYPYICLWQVFIFSHISFVSLILHCCYMLLYGKIDWAGFALACDDKPLMSPFSYQPRPSCLHKFTN